MNTNDTDTEKGTERPWDDADVLYKLYHEQGMNQREMAEELGCARSTIHKAMDRNEVPRRTNRPNHAYFRTTEAGYEHLMAYYDGEQEIVSVHQLVAIACGEAPEVVFDPDTHVHHRNEVSWDNRGENLEVLSRSDHIKHHHELQWGDSPWRDKDLIEELYVEESRSLSEVAEEFGCNRTTVGEWANRHGISTDDYNGSPWRDKETLNRLYVEKGLTTTEIADRFGCNAATVWKWLKKNGIETRNRGGGR